MARLLLYTVLAAIVEAVAVERMVAAPTDVSLPSVTFDFAQITAPPSLHELVKRQEAQTVLVGPDNTCGYVSGYLASAYTCNNVQAQCAFLTYSNIGAVACCNSATCGFRLDCVDYAKLATSSCGVSCQNDPYTVKCSKSATPYCGTATFFNGIEDYYCMTSRYSTAKQMLTTWIGEDDGRTFSPLVLTVTTSADPSASREDGLFGGGDSPTTVTATSSPGNNKNSNTDNNKGGSSTPIGAIVGGVVGGVAILAIVALALFFIIRHNNKKKQRQNAAAAAAANGGYPPQMVQQQQGGPNNGPGGAMTGHQSVYNPVYAQQQQQPQQPQQQYPSPTQSPPPQQQQQQAPPYTYAAPGGDMKPQAYATNVMTPPSPATSPGIEHNRQSMQPASPTMTDVSSIHPHHTGSTMGGGGAGAYQYGNTGSGPNVPTTVHEAGGDAVGNYGSHSNHRGQFHEMQ